MFVIIFVTVVGLALSTLLLPIACFINKAKSIQQWLDKKLKWNWTIRLLLEGLLEMSFCTVFTINYVNRTTFGGWFNLVFAYLLLVLVAALPIFMQVFYQLQFSRMSDPDDEEFHEKYGAPYEGLKPDKRWSLFLPFMVAVRRISFMAVVLTLHQNAFS